ncbi:thiamine phosphate synthase [Terrihabitans sp. B22-R8]|uniref:thiamine phosphate synthase n=1 Tax=Terrihabitans sp. B22-R8 TaxID=3425128 RepID=UPI00403CB45A
MTPKFDLSLYLVAGRTSCGDRNLLDLVEEALAGGVTIVQLRDPDLPVRELVEDGRALRGLLKGRGIPLIINDRVDVALAVEADGVHLGQDDMGARDARRAAGPDLILGLSIGSPDEFEASRDDLPFVDYVGIGPVRGTSTKSDAGAAIGIDGFARVRKLVDRPVVAIGGLAQSQIGDLIAQGADGVAVVSAICGSADPQAAARDLRREIEAAR